MLFWWMDAFASQYCCSQWFWVAPHLYVRLLLSLCTHDLQNPSTISCQWVKSKRLAGVDVSVKQVKLAPKTHQLSLLVKIKTVNICVELIRLSALSVPFIRVPSLRETLFSSDKYFFPAYSFFVHMLHMVPLIKKFLWGHVALPFWQFFQLEIRVLCRISLQKNSSFLWKTPYFSVFLRLSPVHGIMMKTTQKLHYWAIPQYCA